MTRVLLISGKGGVGKTTIAAASAVRAAELGHKTLLLSVDRAHNVGDVLGMKISSEPTSVTSIANLMALEADPQVELRRHWHSFTGYISRFLQWAGLGGTQADETLIFPGLEELLTLSRLNDLVESQEFDLIVVDLAPTASSLRLLSFPDLMSGPFARFARFERKFLKVTRGAFERLSSMPVPADSMYEAFEVLAAKLGRLRDLLINPEQCSVRLVATAERIVIEETRAAFSLLSLFGLCVDSIILNRILPEQMNTGFLAKWILVQKRERERAASLFVDLSLLELAWQEDEVIGATALAQAAIELYGDRDPVSAFINQQMVRFIESDEGTVLELSLHQRDVRSVDLKQRGDELIITAVGWRRQITLPNSLSGRTVRSARLKDGILRVIFAST
ncbi:MAG: ArsA family ATPase [Deltaproteobacteria bacterium]|nr:ArsA family ATPase [Deltaproteobacteria bacterium]